MTPTRERFRARYGRVALICGASEGIGAAFAEELGARGLDLALVARRAGPLDATAAALRARHRVSARTFALDLGRDEDRATLARQLDGDEVGALIHCAARAPIGRFLSLAPTDHDALIALNCRAPTLLAHHFGGRMAARGRGAIVLLSSVAGFQGAALVAHYAASKAYQRVLAEGLWAELAPLGVHVLAVAAGPTDTPGYRGTLPASRAFVEIPPVQSPRAVVLEALAALGDGPVVVPGAINRGFAFLLRRLLPPGLAVRLVSASTRRMYPDPR